MKDSFLKPDQGLWLAAIGAKELEATASRQAPAKPACAPAIWSPNSSLSPEEEFCAICTLLGKLCLMNFLCLMTGKIPKKKKEMTRVKEKITSLCVCVWTGMQILRNTIKIKKQKTKRTMKEKHPRITHIPVSYCT